MILRFAHRNATIFRLPREMPVFWVCLDELTATEKGRVEEDLEDVWAFAMKMLGYGDSVVEVHVVAFEDDGAVESGCGEGVEA
jgi:hypothetical protein